MRNRLLHWIPYRHLPDAVGYRPFRIPYNLMVCIFPEAHPRNDRLDLACPGSAALHIFFWHQRLPTPSGAPARTPGSHPGRAIRNRRVPSVHRSASAPPGFPHFLPHGDSSSQKTYQCNSQCRKQLLRCKACHHTTDAFLCQMLAERSSCDRIDMSRIKEHIRTAL